MEPLLMMRPPRGSWSRIMRKAARAHRKVPVRLAATTPNQSASSVSPMSRAGLPRPALLNNRSRRPNRSRTAANKASTEDGVAHVRGDSQAAVPVCPGARDRLPQRVLASAGQRHGPAIFQQGQHGGTPDAASRARDDGDTRIPHVSSRTTEGVQPVSGGG